MEISRVVTQVKVIGIATGEAPAVTVRKRTVGMGGIVRHFTLVFPVPGRDLFQRLLADVRLGDEIEATVVNEWRETGRVTYLEGFQPMEEAIKEQPAEEMASLAA